MTSRSFHRLAARILLVTFTTCSVGVGQVGAQPPPPIEAPPHEALPPPPTLPAQPPEPLTQAELRDLVAPVALYPDVVLASLLPATTNPDQVHEAAQFVGDAVRVERVPDDRGWDGSIIGLLQFPDVLRWLDENPAWSDEMGQAVTYQQGDVLQAVQDFRRAAKDAGNLTSNSFQRVRAEPDRDIRIEPARPDVVYVPSYDPAVATQPQPVAASPGINPWIAFGGGVVVGALGAWALYSIFDDDGGDHHHHYDRGRRIRSYDNYYYYGRRRPRAVEWAPRQRAYRARPQGGWQHPRRFEHKASAGRPNQATVLRPPTARPLRPREQRRENQRLQRAERQENRRNAEQQRRTQRQDRQNQRRAQRQQAQQQRRQGQQQRQEQRQQRQQQRQQQRRDQRQQKNRQRQDQQAARQQQRRAVQADRQARRNAQQQRHRENANAKKQNQQKQNAKKKH